MILIFFLFFPNLVLQSAPTYNFNDLKALEKTKSYKEFLLHAHDIKPGARDKNWHDLVFKMAIGRIKELSKIESLDTFDEIYKLSSWPQLLENLDVAYEREQWGKQFFTYCLSKNPEKKLWCYQKLSLFWSQHPIPSKFGVELGSLAYEFGLRDQQSLWEYFKGAYSHSMSNLYCTKPIIQEILWNKIVQIELFDKEKLSNEDLDNLINEVCWIKIRKIVNDMVFASDYNKRIVSQRLLKAKHELTSKIEDYFYISYLLENPHPGDMFNWSWRRLETIGSDFKRRHEVLGVFKKLDPLPDRMFATPEPDKSKVIIKLFNDYFPEYLDFYARKCLDFFKGNGDFPNGNPTPHCRDLFKRVSGTNWVPENIQNKYKEELQSMNLKQL